MIITCPCDQKQFEVDENLIPNNGRLVQCGKCGHTWHYKKEHNKNEFVDLNIELNETKQKLKFKKEKKDVLNDIEENFKENEFSNEKNYLSNKYENNTIIGKLFKNTLIVIISLIASLIVIDTFKLHLFKLFPGFEQLINSLYETLTDMKLFLKDLFK